MNYEKAYKEALEKARQFRERPLEEDSSSIVEYIFPELKESDDERIRKVLIDYFNRYKEQEECGIKTFFGIPTDNILAWLEKQGEQTINQHDFEIPFGAKDSELIEESYYIPKGYHAEISKDKVTIKKGEQRPNSQNAQDIIKKYVSDHADCRWLDASELEQLLNDFVVEYDVIKNREYEQQCKVSNDGNNR